MAASIGSSLGHRGAVLAVEVLLEPGGLRGRVDRLVFGHRGAVLAIEVLREPGGLRGRVDRLAIGRGPEGRSRDDESRHEDKTRRHPPGMP